MPSTLHAARRRGLPMIAAAALAVVACQSSSERAASLGAQAQQLFDAQRYFEASQLLLKATAARDDLPDLWLLLGRTRLAMKDYSGAFAAYRAALDLDRANREALAAMAQLSLNRGDFGGAEDYATQIQTLAPDDTLAALVRGYAAIGQQRYADADAIAAPLIAQNPRNTPALVIRSLALERQGHVEQALAVLQPVVGETSPDLLNQLVRLYERMADPRRAAAVLQRQLALAPENSALALNLARQLYLLGRGNQAAALLARFHARNPTDELRAATVATWMDSAASPAAVMASVAALPRPVPALRLALAEYLLARAMPREAAQLLAGTPAPDAATAADADDEGALALAEVLGGDSAGGETRAQAALKLDASQPFALLARARAALARGDTDAALADARLVVHDNPRLPLAYRLLADVYQRRDEALLADRAMDDGASAMPDNAEFLAVNTTRVLARGELEDANNTARDFSVRNPGSMTGWIVRGQVCARTADAACTKRAAIIRQRLAGATIPFPPIPEDESPSDQPRMTM